METNHNLRVGIDFGNTIGEVGASQPFHGSFAIIRHIVYKFGVHNVFVVSKANDSMRDQIMKWLMDHSFFSQTGFSRRNILFVREYSDKAGIVAELGISIFFDDSVKVVRVLAPLPRVERIFWMNVAPNHRRGCIRLMARQFRNKISFPSKWNKAMKYLQKLPRHKPQVV